MATSNQNPFVSAVFVTFSGNCKEALTFYQTCFGGALQFDFFEGLQGYAEVPVINGSLISDSINIHGSDLVHNEGRILGNHIAIFMRCPTIMARKALIEKLQPNKKVSFAGNNDEKLIEITDTFDIRWVLYA